MLAKNGFVVRLSLFYAAFFVFGGISLPFLPAWLAAKGLDAGQIGIVLAAPLIVRLIVVPPIMRLVDRFAMLRRGLVIASVAAVAGIAVVGLSDGFVPILAAYALASIAATVVLPLGDAYALRGLLRHRRSYGSVRLWGSVSFIGANFAGGLVLQLVGAENLIWALIMAQALTAVATLRLLPLSPDHTDVGHTTEAAGSLWRLPMFVAVIAASSLIQSSHAVFHGFSTLQWAARGLEGSAIGALWALGVVAEIALFAVSGRVLAVVRPIDMIVLGGVGAVIRWGVMSFDPPTLALPFLQCLHALSFGATHLGTMQALSDLVPRHRGATAQGDFAAIQGIVFAAEMSLSGILVETYGNFAYAAMAISAAIGGAIALGARHVYADADRN